VPRARAYALCVRPRRLVAGLAVLSALAGCVGEKADETPTAERASPGARGRAAPPGGTGAAEARVVRGWITALNRGDYDAAARFFARDAIVDQGRPIRLRDVRAAKFFNAALPCRADLFGVDDEPGAKALASFRLRAGPGGPCGGIVQVRVTVEGGRFTAWRQLARPPEPSGPVV
jgi:hypothetical protein